MSYMTHRRRLETVLKGEVPDCVPCCPDISNMVPCRLTRKPFWDIYLYHDPPLWKAYIDAVKYFGFDGGFELYDFGDVDPVDNTRLALQERIIFDSSSEDGNGRIVTRRFDLANGSWHPFVTVYTAGTPPGAYFRPESIGLPPVPDEWKPVVRRKEWPEGRELWELIRRELGEAGILGLGSGMKTALLETEDDIISYYEDSGPWKERYARMMTGLEERMRRIAGMEPRPDFLF